MSVADRLVELSRITDATHPVVSVYLDTRWADEHQRERARIFVRNEIEKARRAEPGGALDDDLAWIDAHGVAMFACGALGLREVLPVRVQVADTFVVARTPFLRPLAALLDAAPPVLVVFVDGERARLIPVGEAGAGEEVSLESEVPGHHRRGGWAQLAQSRYQRHIQDHRARHLEAVAEALAQLAEAHGLERIVLAGDTRNVSALRAHLPPRIADRVAGTIAGARYEAAAALVGRAQELVGHVEELEDTDAVDTVLTEAAKSGRAVAGLEATLEAVRRGAVYRLYLLKAFADAGRACDGCGALQGGQGERCRLCGAGTRPVDLGSAMVERVLATGGRIETIETHGGLARVGGVAARIRYPI